MKVDLKQHCNRQETMQKMKRAEQPRGKPERLEVKLCHVRQRYNWDCGVSCVLMVLPEKERLKFLDNFNDVCKDEGFNKSTWTIDLCYLLARFHVRHRFYTTTLGVHPGHRANSFYQNALTKDERRVIRRFETAMANDVRVRRASLDASSLVAHLNVGPVILLTNAKLLGCERCKLNKITTELRKCLPWPVTYQGHYIVLCGYNVTTQKVFYRNPSFCDRVCVMSFETLEEARRSYGTDEDTILVYA